MKGSGTTARAGVGASKGQRGLRGQALAGSFSTPASKGGLSPGPREGGTLQGPQAADGEATSSPPAPTWAKPA